MTLFTDKDEDDDDDTFIPLKKSVESIIEVPKKPLFGDDSEEETAKPATSELAEPEEIK